MCFGVRVAKGMAVHLRLTNKKAEALEAVGLSE